MIQNIYDVGGHCFSVQSNVPIMDVSDEASPYKLFETDSLRHEKCEFQFAIEVYKNLPPPPQIPIKLERTDYENYYEIVGVVNDGLVFLERGSLPNTPILRIIAEEENSKVQMICTPASLYAFKTQLMRVFALRTLPKKTFIYHAAVIEYNGKGYLFIAAAGTGKSTHAGLWQNHIPGARILNDDQPIVRIHEDGSVWVYGSPWGGKSPVFRNECMPVGGIVHLAQAPHNSIRPMRGVQAYVELHSALFGLDWNRLRPDLADSLHESMTHLVSTVRLWHLDCLPDEDAVRLCCDTITKD